MNTAYYSNGCRFRWICNACFEIELPSGKIIVVDPYIDECATKPFNHEQICGADYILISHIHFDHILDVHNLWKRFDSKIFVGDISAEELCRNQDIPAGSIYRIRGGANYVFDDVRIEVLAARHTEWKQGVFVKSINEINEISKRPDTETRLLWLGFLEMYNFRITTPNGTSFIIWGGMPTEDQVHLFSGTRPDIAAMHVSPNQDMELFMRLCEKMNPKFIVPHHYDLSELLLKENPELLQLTNTMSPKELIEYLKVEIPKRVHASVFSDLERGKWYSISSTLRLMD